ncbi:MAG: hypothetical protein ACSHWU_02060 [Marinicella sp.]
MKRFHLIVIFCLIHLTACTQQQVARSAIEDMLDDIEIAVNAHDSQRLLRHFLANAHIVIKATPELGGDFEIGVKEYGLLLELSWSLPADYFYEVKDLNIEYDAENDRATVKSKVYEKIAVQDQVVLSTVTDQTLEVIFMDGMPLIENYTGLVLTHD